LKIKPKVPLTHSLTKASNIYLSSITGFTIPFFSLWFQNEGRMFRVQFGGDSKEEMLENCWSCVRKLTEYVPVQGTEEQSQQLCPSLSQLAYGDSQNKMPFTAEVTTPFLSWISTTLCFLLPQSVLNKKLELPPAPWHPVWGTQELGPFIRFCLLDQHFPAFVQAVEKELQKLTEG
uniref:REC114 meiotic recombination protein n=1 Tax=Amazona collaria TaxID=241587 RepID=A0A8B9GER9_9PSIT